MKFRINREQFLTGLQTVVAAIKARTTLPILSNVLMRLKGTTLQLAATDLDLTIQCNVECEGDGDGDLTLPAHKLVQIMREIGATEIAMTTNDKFVAEIQAGSSNFKLRGLASDEFPPLPKLTGGKTVELTQQQLKSAIDRIAFAQSEDESRFVLNGILFQVKDGKFITVATDGRRLGLCELEVDVPKSLALEFIVPTGAVNILQKHLTDKGTVELLAFQNNAVFNLGFENGFSVAVTSKLIEGNYPNYKQVIPVESAVTLPIRRQEFLSAVNRVALMTNDKQNSIKLHFNKNECVLTANAPDSGEARESIGLKYGDKEKMIAVNPAYLSDPLAAMPNDELTFSMTDELSPALLRADGWLYVVMPMRLS